MSLSGAIASSSAGPRGGVMRRPSQGTQKDLSVSDKEKEKKKQEKRKESTSGGSKASGSNKSSCILMVAIGVFCLLIPMTSSLGPTG